MKRCVLALLFAVCAARTGAAAALPDKQVLVLYSTRRTTQLVALADREAVRVDAGNTAVVEFDAFPGRRFPGRVSRIDSAADPVTGTFEAEIEVAPQQVRNRVDIGRHGPARAAEFGRDRGRGLWEVFLLLTRLDEMLVVALIRLWRSS